MMPRSHLKMGDDVVGYLPTINAPAATDVYITGNSSHYFENHVLTPTGKHCCGT